MFLFHVFFITIHVCTHTLTHTHSHTHSHSIKYNIHMYTLTLTHSLTHTHTLSHTHRTVTHRWPGPSTGNIARWRRCCGSTAATEEHTHPTPRDSWRRCHEAHPPASQLGLPQKKISHRIFCWGAVSCDFFAFLQGRLFLDFSLIFARKINFSCVFSARVFLGGSFLRFFFGFFFSRFLTQPACF